MMRSHRGFTLIESLVVIALTGATLTIVTVIMHSLRQAEQRVRDDLQGQRTLDQVEAQLRWDAHEALAVATVGGRDASAPRGLVLTLADGRSIQYSLAANRLERLLRRGEAVEHREGYRLAFPDGYWTVDTRRDRPLLTLHLFPLDPRQVSQPANTNEWTIQAAVGIIGSQAKKGGRDEKQP